jgi:hypothetical protein
MLTTGDALGLLVFALALSWLWDKEMSEASEVEAEYTTAAQFSIQLPWVPSNTTQEELRGYLSTALGLHPVDVSICYDYGPLLRVSSRRRKLLDQLEEVDNQLGRFYNAAGLRFTSAVHFDKEAFKTQAVSELLHGAHKDVLRTTSAVVGPMAPAQRAALHPASSSGAGAGASTYFREKPAGGAVGSGHSQAAERGRLRPALASKPASVTAKHESSSNTATARATATAAPDEMDERSRVTVNALLAKRRQLLQSNRVIQRQVVSARAFGGAIGAFVTFNTHKEARKALDMMSEGRVALLKRYVFESSGMRFRGEFPLRSRKPPRPSTVLWHNLMVSATSQCGRRMLTGTGAALLLCISIAVVFAGRQLEAADLESVAASKSNSSATSSSSGPSIGQAVAGISPSQTQPEALTPVPATPLLLLIPVFISGVNVALNKLMRNLAGFERHHTATQLELSIMSRLQFRQFFNTAVVVAIVYMDKKMLVGTVLYDLWPAGGFSSFDADWYRVVGSSICATLFLDLVSPWMFTFLKLTVQSLKLLLHTRGIVVVRSQRQLDRLHIGPEMDIADRYARLINTALVALTFSSGMPIVLWIATLCFTVAYWVDKWLFVSCLRTPPHYSAQISRTASNTLAHGVILHSIIGLFMFAGARLPSVTSYDSGPWLQALLGARIDRQGLVYQTGMQLAADHMWMPLGLAAAVMCVLFAIVCRWLLTAAMQSLCPRESVDNDSAASSARSSRGRVGVAGSSGSRRLRALSRGTYKDLVREQLLQDLCSYDVHIHPAYQDAFTMAKTHSSLHRRRNGADERT